MTILTIRTPLHKWALGQSVPKSVTAARNGGFFHSREYRKAGYSKKFFEEHREAITLHKAAKAAFEQLGLKKLPRVKELNAEYAQLLEQKKATYPAYRKARTEMQEYLVAQKVAAVLLEKEKEQAAIEERRKQEQNANQDR